MTSILWFVPRLEVGSGGHATILRHVQYQWRQGSDVTLCFQSSEEATLSEKIIRNYGLNDIDITPYFPASTRADIAIATVAWSAQPVSRLRGVARRLYFVQDWEAWFNPISWGHTAAAQSYCLDLEFVTIGRYLASRVASVNPSARIWTTPFGIDEATYSHDADFPVLPGQGVLACYQPDKPRRMAELIDAAFEIAQKSFVGRGIPLATFGYGQAHTDSPTVSNPHGGERVHFGLVKEPFLANLYKTFRLGLSISTTNMSRIPFEMMACGLHCLEIASPSAFWDLPPENSTLVFPGAESMASAINRLISPERPAKRLSETLQRASTIRDELEAFHQAITSSNAANDSGHTTPQYAHSVLVAESDVRAGALRYLNSVLGQSKWSATVI